MLEQQKYIERWYKELFDIIKKNISKLGLDSSDKVTYKDKTSFKVLEKSLDKIYFNITKNLKSLAFEAMQYMCEQVIDEIQEQIEIEVDKKNLIEEIVSSVILGTIYNTNWTLSSAVQKIVDNSEDLIESIIEEGIAEGRSPEEIIEDILNVLNPDPNVQQRSYTRKHKTLYVGRPDYQAQRLLRTVIQHTYQTSVVSMAKTISMFMNKQVMIQWISALAPNTCQVCIDRHLHLYDPDDLPLDHPNGQCTFEIKIL